MNEIKEIFFDNIDDVMKCFDKWKSRLGLSDWNIGLSLVEPDELDDGNAGESDVQWVNMCGTIKLLKKEFYPKDCLLKQPHEQVLIHELLHFKFYALQPTTLEAYFYDMKQHQLLEEIAKALFMAEYNLTPDWFIKEETKYGQTNDSKRDSNAESEVHDAGSD